MLSRDQILANIDEAYAARIRGDKAALAGFWAEDARFELPGDRAAFASFYDEALAGARGRVEQIMDRVEMHSIERVNEVVEDNRAAILWRARVTIDGKPPLETLLYDLFELNEDGKFRSLTQFCDTALFARMNAEGAV